MMNLILNTKLSKFLVYSNIYISLCAVSQLLVTYTACAIPFTYNNVSYILFVFLSTFLQYNLQRDVVHNRLKLNPHSERAVWYATHKKKILIASGGCLFTLLFLCNNLSFTSIVIMISAEVISTIYYLPPFNLRKHGSIKPFIVAIIWLVSCVIVPIIENQIFTFNMIWYIVSQLLFITSLCIIFDVKDMAFDASFNIKTYPILFGINKTKLIVYVLVVLSVVSNYIFVIENESVLIINSLFLLISLLTIYFIKPTTSLMYYFIYVDGLLILQYLTILL